MTKKWHILHDFNKDILTVLLKNRGITDASSFLHVPSPQTLTPKDVGIDKRVLTRAINRITSAIKNKESIVVYADYDADGITAGAIMWETLHRAGALVMPYIPHRTLEGYGLSQKGIDTVRAQYDPSLIITVDHGITARKQVAYAKSLGIDVIVTDHHVKPEQIPDTTIVHTTELCGAGVSWFVARHIGEADIALAGIGTIADMVPLVGPNRSIVKDALEKLRTTNRVGLQALFQDAGITAKDLSTYDISHVVAPRLNAVGRLVHAMDALRLICTTSPDKAIRLARELGITNKERQTLTEETSLHAKERATKEKLIFVSHESYNPGVIGLVAGKLVEEFYRPAIVVSTGSEISKASARSIRGFNIIEAIRSAKDLLVDVGGHPMAAGFTVETKNIEKLKKRLEKYASDNIDDAMLARELRIDMELPIRAISESLWQKLQSFEPYGIGNPEPVFASRSVTIHDDRLIGVNGKHLKFRVGEIEAVAFGMGHMIKDISRDKPVDIAYTIDMNVWNGRRSLQLKVKDIIARPPHSQVRDRSRHSLQAR